jgi:prephenate dehydrogenase
MDLLGPKMLEWATYKQLRGGELMEADNFAATSRYAGQVFEMAPKLAASQHGLICDIIMSKSLTTAQMADIAG